MTAMSDDAIAAFLAEPRIAKLATLNTDGSPTIVPVWFEWDGTAASVFTHYKTPKLRRIRHDGRVALSVEEPLGVMEAWVTLEGTATVQKQGAIELARRLIVRYYTEERVKQVLPTWEKIADEWRLIRIVPKTIRSSAPGTS